MHKVANNSEKYYVFNIVSNKLIIELSGKDELIHWFARSQNSKKEWSWDSSKYNNKYLDNLNITGEDTYLLSTYTSDGFNYDYVTREYMVIDGYNRVIDVRLFYKDILAEAKRLSNIPYKYDRGSWYISAMRRDVGKNYNGAKFRQEPVPYIRHRRGYKFYRRIRTTNELRQNTAPEMKEFVRASRREHNLPTSWDERSRHIDNCWKSQRKCRKQWMKNLRV